MKDWRGRKVHSLSFVSLVAGSLHFSVVETRNNAKQNVCAAWRFLSGASKCGAQSHPLVAKIAQTTFWGRFFEIPIDNRRTARLSPLLPMLEEHLFDRRVPILRVPL